MASFVKGSTYEVTKVDGNKKLLLSDITSWYGIMMLIKVSALQLTSTSKRIHPKLKLLAISLNIRQQADFNSKIIGTISKGGSLYSFLEEKKNGVISI